MMEHQELLEVANDLTNDNICDLINMVAPRLDVLLWKLLNMTCLSSGSGYLCLNERHYHSVSTASRQILKTLRIDDFIAGAIERLP